MQGGDFLANQGPDAGAPNFATAFLADIQQADNLPASEIVAILARSGW